MSWLENAFGLTLPISVGLTENGENTDGVGVYHQIHLYVCIYIYIYISFIESNSQRLNNMFA